MILKYSSNHFKFWKQIFGVVLNSINTDTFNIFVVTRFFTYKLVKFYNSNINASSKFVETIFLIALSITYLLGITLQF